MGSALASMVCATAFCLERIMTWTFCALILITVMCSLFILAIYGISVGYHYAQKELAGFAFWSRVVSKPRASRRSQDDQPMGRMLPVNASLMEPSYQLPLAKYYKIEKPDNKAYLNPLNEESEYDLSQRRFDRGRIRRSKNVTTDTFLRPFRDTTTALTGI